MADPIYRQLLGQARRLARLDPLRPKQGNLRRSISSAYYSIFHFVSDQACRCVLGGANERRPFRDILGRAFEHGNMKRACTSFAGGTLPKTIQDRLPADFAVPPVVQSLAQTFKEAQEKRNLADYDLSQTFARADVLALIRDVEQAIGNFAPVSGRIEGRFFLGCVLVWDSLIARK